MSLPRTIQSVLDLVAAGKEQDLDGQRALTASLESLAKELERRMVQGNGSVPTPKAPEPEVAAPREKTGSAADFGAADFGAADFAAAANHSIAFLRSLIRTHPARLDPVLDAGAPLGHRYPMAEEILHTDAATTVEALEEMSDLGLLQRSLVNRVHVCSACNQCHLNFREECPRCESIDLKVERVLHHFRCGYTGIESEFGGGLDLRCPKCRRDLFQLGQDFDRPHETYVCRSCEVLFEEPRIGAQCLDCATESAGHDAPQQSIYAYLPTPLSSRAVELGRLTGLEVDSILYDAELKIATRDFLEFEIKRELVRLNRHATAFSTATISFERNGRPVPIFRDWTAATLRELCVMLADSLRSLDLVTRLDASRLGILMPEADEPGAAVVRRRLFSQLNEMTFVDRSGNDVVPTWVVSTWGERRQPFDEVRRFLFPDEDTAEPLRGDAHGEGTELDQ